MPLRVFSIFKSPRLRLRLLRGNIAEWKGDCIVNAANVQLEPSQLPDYWRHIGRKDVNSALHASAGPGLAEECALLPKVPWSMTQQDRVASAPGDIEEVRCPRGEARLTGGHALGCKHVIHAVGPDYDTSVRCAGSVKAAAAAHVLAEEALAATYANVLALANQVSAESISFPAISCGVNGFGGFDSLDAAARVSLRAVLQHAGLVKLIDFVLYDDHCAEAWEEAADAHADLERED
eukprot:TRINITY_DN113347_c0_g1_i1.p1 TRINITY_DN113347_c0_g1~~TRINITY_DN113347_c0_g1_i1.p1  ORF type:complete len:236 (-),score=50.80 TRINITY_DN113347_c0_g1_i1:79-786(-)